MVDNLDLKKVFAINAARTGVQLNPYNPADVSQAVSQNLKMTGVRSGVDISSLSAGSSAGVKKLSTLSTGKKQTYSIGGNVKKLMSLQGKTPAMQGLDNGAGQCPEGLKLVNGKCRLDVQINSKKCPSGQYLSVDGKCIDWPTRKAVATRCPPGKIAAGDGKCVDMAVQSGNKCDPAVCDQSTGRLYQTCNGERRQVGTCGQRKLQVDLSKKTGTIVKPAIAEKLKSSTGSSGGGKVVKINLDKANKWFSKNPGARAKDYTG